MITVAVLINGQPIYTRSAVRESGSISEICTYRCDDGSIITHTYDDGAVTLAHKMLDTIKETTKEERQKRRLEELLKVFKQRNGVS